MNLSKKSTKFILLCGAVLMGLSTFATPSSVVSAHSRITHTAKVTTPVVATNTNGNVQTMDPQGTTTLKASKVRRMSNKTLQKVLRKPGELRVVGRITPSLRNRLNKQSKKAKRSEGQGIRMTQIHLSGYGLHKRRHKPHTMPYKTLIHRLSNRKLGKVHRGKDMHAVNKDIKARNLTGMQYTKMYRAMVKDKTGSRKGLHHMCSFYDAVIRMQTKHYTFQDINRARRQHGRRKNKSAHNLERVSKVRSKQAAHAYETQPTKATAEQRHGNDKYSDGWIHGMMHHQTAIDDAKRLHINIAPKGVKGAYIIAENAGDIVPAPRMATDSAYKKDRGTMRSMSPKQFASDEINGMLHHDHASHNGHRKNILGKKLRYMGVGVYFTMSGHGPHRSIHGAIVQDFES